VSILFALVRSLTVDKIKKTKDIVALSQLPLYGNIPLYKNNMLQDIEIEEAYRKLAVNLQFTKREYEGHVILISSSVEGEGKTTTVAALSSIFNQTGEKSIVVDMDLYNPSLHTYFGLDAQYSGLSTFLSQRDNLGNVIFTTRYPHLDILPAGPIPPNPSELILSRNLELLLETLKQRYDYIFIDTASFETAPETFYLMQYSDLNLVVFRQNFSKKIYLSNLERNIREKHLQNVGLIVKSEPLRKKREQLSRDIILDKPLLLDSTV
jgi:capsular exopolysaccharide synthesis family protein